MGATESEVVRRPHLVLPHTRDPDGVLGCSPVEVRDDLLRLKQPVVGIGPARGVGGLDALDLTPPRRDVNPPLSGDVVTELGTQGRDDVGQIANDRDVGGADLGDLGRVDVDVDDRGLRGEGVWPTGDPVIEAGPQADDDIGPLQGPDGGNGSVHSGHLQVERMLTGHDVQRGQRGDERRPDEIDELGQVIGGHLRTIQATAEVEDGAVGSGDHLGGLSQAPLIGLAGQTVAGQVPGRGPHELSGPLLGVLGDVDEDGSRTTG